MKSTNWGQLWREKRCKVRPTGWNSFIVEDADALSKCPQSKYCISSCSTFSLILDIFVMLWWNCCYHLEKAWGLEISDRIAWPDGTDRKSTWEIHLHDSFCFTFDCLLFTSPRRNANQVSNKDNTSNNNHLPARPLACQSLRCKVNTFLFYIKI